MGCCLSKNPPQASSSSLIDGSCSVKSPDLNKSAIDTPLKLEAQEKKIQVEESKPRNEEEKIQEDNNSKPRKEVFVIKHRRSHEKSSKTTTDPEDSSVSDVKSTGSNHNPVDVDAILIQCGRLSRSNSAAAKTRRYSGSKRSFDFDQNGGDADAEDGGEDEEAERRIHRQRQRGGESPRERRRRTPSRERDDSKSNRSGSRERGSSGNGGGSRRVSRSPGRRSEINPNSSGNSVNSSNNNRPGKFVSVPATDKALSNNNGDGSVKRITVKRNVGKAASPRSQSPARAASQPSPSKLSRKTEHSPYRRNPLSEIDPNSVAFPLSQGDKLGSGNNIRMMNRDNENQGLVKESGTFVAQKLNPVMNTKTVTQAPIRRTASPSRAIKEQQEAVEECKIVVSSGTELAKPQIVSRSRSLRKSRDFDFSPEALLSNNIDINNVNSNNATAGSTFPSYTALLLEDIQNFHQKSVNVSALSSSMSKACSIVEAVADLNSATNQHQRTEVSFTSAAAKKADLMEPSFEKYVTVKRGGSSLDDMEEQESSGSNSFTGSSCVVQRQGYSSSSSWEPNSAESTDRVSMRSSNKQERDRSPLGVNYEKQEFDPLKKNGVGVGRKRVAVVDSSSSGKGVLQATTTRVAAVSM
ncbi:hypothetical protein AtNW77_Chr5g0118361 [Arabidopsis thaliana]|uniref:At5g37010 n=4 Tax=Arabidopsis TaxID=3701 RepID=Q9FGV2_ARATH|nr:rho GTPase-activating protein [Arabidopsis thaliana]KAG7604042.1 hypothetical protein ISN45_At05g031290 [Arabidopsis thaliana x Arabidopsis arenosa]KAG7610956.1 hypothetical protein ISN44_As05g030750 [Arabidopsis suecica]AAO64878.1 At5g37010 [Arabidopsis thaliana]AED94136.1 rho GTPase-activating protein [Arabidopsis thaliana]OAO95080.1 hypothetical protein AXX17_AT5G33980 [Arabidopsis thaliana]|eukprot:NP_198517.2 rho GTPase-activating protein [Arabidopsis thaliana]